MTTIPLIVVLVLLVLCPLILKNQKGARNGLILVLLIAAVGLVIANTRSQMKPKADPGSQTYQLHEVAMTKLGEILAGDLKDGGKVIVFQMADLSDGLRKVNAADLAGLKSGVGGNEFDFVVINRAEGVAPMSSSMDRPATEDIRKALAEHADAAAVVTCIDLPLTELDSETLPPVYVFDVKGTRFWTDALAQGTVKAAIVAREDVPSPPAGQSTSSIFEALFEIKMASVGES